MVSAPNNERSMPKRRRIWFWAGVVLLTLSALFWLFLVIGMATDPQDLADMITGGAVLTIIPVGIAIYGVLWGGKSRTRETVATGISDISPSNDLQSVVVIKSRLKIVLVGWVFLLCGGSMLVVTLAVIGNDPGVVRDPGLLAFLGGFTAFMFLFAARALGSTTKISFLPGYMVVSRGHIPLFLWFLRTKNVSMDGARRPGNILILVAGDPARSRSAYCPARTYNQPVTKRLPSLLS